MEASNVIVVPAGPQVSTKLVIAPAAGSWASPDARLLDSAPELVAMTGGPKQGPMRATDGGTAMGRQHASRQEAAGHVRPPEAPSPSPVEASSAEPRLVDALVLLAARLQERHPAASAAMVQRSIDDAVRAFSSARVRVFLPILIERMASDALREASRSRERAALTSPSMSGSNL